MLIPEEWSRLLSLANLSLSEEETQSSSELRPDILAPSLKQEVVLQNAPEKDEAFFLTRGKF